MKIYQGLDFETVKDTIASYCSFSLSKQAVLQADANFSYLYAKRDNERGREALRLYKHHGAPSFGGVHDLYDLWKAIKKGKIASIEELEDIYHFIYAHKQMQTYRKSWEIKAPILEDLISSLIVHTNQYKLIEACVHIGSGELKDGASEALQSIRKHIRANESDLSQKTNALLQQYSSILMDSIIAYRNGRACLLVKSGDKHKIKGFIHDESASGQAVYIEPEVLLLINNRIQTLYANEKNEIERILKEISKTLQPISDELSANLETMTLLDTLFAKAHWAFNKNAIYADLHETQERLYFKDARHPLINEDDVIANTYELRAPYRQLLISGSNTGGKTVTLKVIGLFSLMSLAGFPIPCAEAKVPVFDGIFVDVGDFQSIVESLSTFSAHISSLSHILESASAHSLVLLDELGSGTDPKEGECLAIAILHHLQEHNIMSVATTHYAKVKEYATSQDSILLSSVGFDMERMMPTYVYMQGYSGNSNAFEIAKRYHMKEEILQYARALREANLSESELLLEALQQEKLTLKKEKEQFEKAYELFRQQQHAFTTNKDAQLAKQQKAIDEKMQEAQIVLDEAKQNAKAVIRDLRAMGNVKEHELIEKVSKLKTKTDPAPIEVEEVFALHDYVEVIGLQYHGEIISLRGNRATINANGMKMQVKTHEITHTARPKQVQQVNISTKQTSKRISGECNIIGMHVEEALPVVKKYLDNAVLHKMYQVRIIHGSGTGALRSAVHEYIKKQAIVKEYRLGGEYEGGLGATIVRLKGAK
ncbi:MAG: endonuclease MutS2 [Breznakia sp.]